MDEKGHYCIKCGKDWDDCKCTAISESPSVTGYTLGDYDRWFKPCGHCGYDSGKKTDKCEARCWKCGRSIQRDYSERALKKKSV